MRACDPWRHPGATFVESLAFYCSSFARAKKSRLTPRASLYFVGFLHPGGVSNPLVALGTSASLSHRIKKKCKSAYAQRPEADFVARRQISSLKSASTLANPLTPSGR